MRRHDSTVALRHMLDHSREAVAMLDLRSRADLDRDRQLNLALVRLLEVVGESASRVATDAREGYPQIPWYQIIGLRNRLIHGYDSVDFDVLWQIVRNDLPSLIATLEEIVPRAEGR